MIENQKNNTFSVFNLHKDFTDSLPQINNNFHNLSFNKNNEFMFEKTKNTFDNNLYIRKIEEIIINGKKNINKDLYINKICEINFDRIKKKDIKITTKKIIKYTNTKNKIFPNITFSKENQFSINGILKINKFKEKLNEDKSEKIDIICEPKKEIKIVTKKILKKTNILSNKFKNVEITDNNQLEIKNSLKKEIPLEIILNEKININGNMKSKNKNLIIYKKNEISIIGKQKEIKFDKQKLLNDNQNNIFIPKNVKQINNLRTEQNEGLKNILPISNEQFSLKETLPKEITLLYKKTKTKITVSPKKENCISPDRINIQISGIKNQKEPTNIFNQIKLINDKNSELTIKNTLLQKDINISEIKTNYFSILHNSEKQNEEKDKKIYEKIVDKNIQFSFDKVMQKQIEKIDEMTQIVSNEKEIEKTERTTDTDDLILPKQIKITTKKTIKTINHIQNKFKNNEISSENNINIYRGSNIQKIKKDNIYIIKNNDLIIKKSYSSPKENKKETKEKCTLINWTNKLNIDDAEKFNIINLPKREIRITTKKILKSVHNINHKFKNNEISSENNINIYRDNKIQKIKKDNIYIIKNNDLIIKKSYSSPKENKKETKEKCTLINWTNKLNIDSTEKFNIINLPKREIKITTKKILKSAHHINHKFKNACITKTDELNIKGITFSKLRNIDQNYSFTINQTIKKTKENETEISDDLLNIKLINNDEFTFNKKEKKPFEINKNKLDIIQSFKSFDKNSFVKENNGFKIQKNEKIKNTIEGNSKFTILKKRKQETEEEETETEKYNINMIKNTQFTINKLEKIPKETTDEEIQFDEKLIPEKKEIKLVTKKTLKKTHILSHKFKDNIISQGNQFTISGKKFENINEVTKDTGIKDIFANNKINNENIKKITKDEKTNLEHEIYKDLKIKNKNIVINTKIRKVVNTKSNAKLGKVYKKIKNNCLIKNTFDFWKKLIENDKKEEKKLEISELRIEKLNAIVLKIIYKSFKNNSIKLETDEKSTDKKKRKINISKLSVKQQVTKMTTSSDLPVDKKNDAKEEIVKLQNSLICKNKQLLISSYFKLWKSFNEN